MKANSINKREGCTILSHQKFVYFDGPGEGGGGARGGEIMATIMEASTLLRSNVFEHSELSINYWTDVISIREKHSFQLGKGSR